MNFFMKSSRNSESDDWTKLSVKFLSLSPKIPAETRMGKGKGTPEYWVAVIKPGRILFEIDGLSFEDAKRAFKACGHKLNIKTKIVEKRNLGN